ncbi:lycopene cyclase family protein [Arsenicibacter rosenii]|uniref:Lycopene cyclase n=1 Tax=Arsenicibacter rosenii TaxID=1750698 RepID=A0A1S2VB80_9BACT|nr:lycopene cyclase family protein [Arsenicibacter rosenii]OIN55984.1 lycopene cyclase [Arsenicibacter rosenii]
MKKYDFIIAGGGMAGLSLAYHLSQSPLRDRSILILDKEDKKQNDRTWCFWEEGEGPFESILFRKWQTVEFHGTGFAGPLDLGNYQYKMLRGIDFYDHVRSHLAQFPNIEFRQATINRVKETPQGGFVIANDEPYMATYVFDSTFPLDLKDPDRHNLLQHFKGWVITTQKPCFDTGRPRMMDFRTDQRGDCRFVYVLPFNETTALVEYTIFNERLLPEADYEQALKQYIANFLDTGSYQISETEYGVIPMSDVPTKERPSKHIVRIGTAGGHTKPSTGYTFQRTQRAMQAIVRSLVTRGKPRRRPSWLRKRFKLYDSILLNVLEQNRYPADDMFTRLYEDNPPTKIFKFLDEDTSLGEEFRIINSMPKKPFTIALLHVLWRRAF